MQKNYIGIVRDHSVSMRGIAKAAAKDYNSKISSIKKSTLENDQDTIVSVVECAHGHTREAKAVVTNSNVTALQPLENYVTNGPGTPLFDSVGKLIEMFENVPDVNDPNVSFLVMAITDGEENSSRHWSARSLAVRIRELNATDRWTFVFRVPRGYGHHLASLGISQGNILEWDQTERGTMQAAKQDEEAFTQYFSERSKGVTSTQRFYADLTKVKAEDVAAVMTDISNEVVLYPVTADSEIRSFIEARTKAPMKKGTCFYQLTKSERAVQDYKKILIRDKVSQAIYHGAAARQLLGVPVYGDVKLSPGSHGQYDIFIQSTSVNRKLTAGSMLAYWENA